MKTLILDSTNIDLNVGLAIDNKLVSYVSYPCWQQQSEKMIPEIDQILKNNHIDPKEINEIIVTKGPGSYTGIRIALTIAKVYAYSLKIPCYAISSLEALAKLNVPSICLINARSNRSYIGVYNSSSNINDTIYTNEEVLKFINDHQDYVVCGDTNYLNIEGYKANLLSNLLALKNENNLVKDIFTLKATYLKD